MVDKVAPSLRSFKTSELWWEWGVATIIYILLNLSYAGQVVGYDRLVLNQLPDANDYAGIALSLVTHHTFGEPALSNNTEERNIFLVMKDGLPPVSGVHQSAWRPPLWPVIMSLFLIAGNGDFYWLLVLKYLLGLCSLLMLAVILKYLDVDKVWRRAGLLLAAMSPGLLIYTHQMLTESLTLLFITTFIALSYRQLIDVRWVTRRSVAMGLVGGLLILSHPYYLFMPFVIAAIGLRVNRNMHQVVIVSGVTVAIVSLWVARNAVVYDGQLMLTSSTGAAFAKGWNSEVLGRFTNTQGDLANETVDVSTYYPELNIDSLDEAQRSKLYVHTAVAFIAENWRLVVPISLRKIASGLNPIHETNKSGLLETGRVLYAVLLLLPLVFFRRMAGMNGSFALLYASAVGSYFLMGVLSYTGVRFRFPILMIEIAALALLGSGTGVRSLMVSMLRLKGEK